MDVAVQVRRRVFGLERRRKQFECKMFVRLGRANMGLCKWVGGEMDTPNS